jgi:hypothetical protein
MPEIVGAGRRKVGRGRHAVTIEPVADRVEPMACPAPCVDPAAVTAGGADRGDGEETERARTVHAMGTGESMDFWRDYLAHFHYNAKVPDYWHILEHAYGLK